jgi:hypothetical protein
MRHYDRLSYRHLDDSERYRDYDYLGDDAWVGPNERVPHGVVNANEPPWSTLGGYETGPFLGERAFDDRRGQGREYGRDLGLGYGREHDAGHAFERSQRDDYDRGYARPSEQDARLVYPREVVSSPSPRTSSGTPSRKSAPSFFSRALRWIFGGGGRSKTSP